MPMANLLKQVDNLSMGYKLLNTPGEIHYLEVHFSITLKVSRKMLRWREVISLNTTARYREKKKIKLKRFHKCKQLSR